jgi:hypothetical protein
MHADYNNCTERVRYYGSTGNIGLRTAVSSIART